MARPLSEVALGAALRARYSDDDEAHAPAAQQQQQQQPVAAPWQERLAAAAAAADCNSWSDNDSDGEGGWFLGWDVKPSGVRQNRLPACRAPPRALLAGGTARKRCTNAPPALNLRGHRHAAEG